MWKFSLLNNDWKELKLIRKPAPRHGFVAGTFDNYWYISHGELMKHYMITLINVISNFFNNYIVQQK